MVAVFAGQTACFGDEAVTERQIPTRSDPNANWRFAVDDCITACLGVFFASNRFYSGFRSYTVQ